MAYRGESRNFSKSNTPPPGEVSLSMGGCGSVLPRDLVTSALQQLHWLPVYYRIQYKLCLLMYSACHQHCPAYISNMVQSVATSTHRQGLRSSTCPTYVVPRTRTKLGERAFSVSGPVAWNALPANIRSTADSKLFKRLLKTHFAISRLTSLRNCY